MKTFEKSRTLFACGRRGEKKVGRNKLLDTRHVLVMLTSLRNAMVIVHRSVNKMVGGGRELEEGKRMRRKEKEVERGVQSLAKVQSPHPPQEDTEIFIDLRMFGTENMHMCVSRWRILRCDTCVWSRKLSAQNSSEIHI